MNKSILIASIVAMGVLLSSCSQNPKEEADGYSGATQKKYSNKLMQLRVLLQFIAIIVLVLLAYFFKS